MMFIPGTMKMYVREINTETAEAWLVQEVNMMIQKQKVEALIDTNTGATKKLLVDGQEQQIPASNYEIIEKNITGYLIKMHRKYVQILTCDRCHVDDTRRPALGLQQQRPKVLQHLFERDSGRNRQTTSIHFEQMEK